jgi:hypothetical protein
VAYISTTDNSIKKLTSGGIKGMRSYFQIPIGSNTRSLVLKFDGENTAIKEIEGNVTEGTVYNVAGQRAEAAHMSPRHKGIYIMNGKKVVR